MAHRPYVAPAEIVRPPLTPNDAARVAGTLKHGDGRPDFLRKTVDMIDRSDVDAEDRLRRFIQDWQYHAKAGMLVELGETLAYLVEGVGQDSEEAEERERRASIVDGILAKVTGFDEVEDLKVEQLVDAFSLLEALAEEYEVHDGWEGYPELREKLIDNRVKADDATDQVDALKAEVEALKAEIRAERKANGLLRNDLQGLVNRVGHLHGEATRIAADVFGVTPVGT